MEWTDISIAVCTVLATIVSLYTLFNKRFDKIDQRFDRIDQRFDKIESEIYSVNGRLSNIEGQITQMTRPRFIINPKNDHEEPLEN